MVLAGVYFVLGGIFRPPPVSGSFLKLSSLHGGSKNTRRSMYRRDKRRNVPLRREDRLTQLWPDRYVSKLSWSSEQQVHSALSGCWDNTVRKLEASRPPMYVLGSKLNHLSIAVRKEFPWIMDIIMYWIFHFLTCDASVLNPCQSLSDIRRRYLVAPLPARLWLRHRSFSQTLAQKSFSTSLPTCP